GAFLNFLSQYPKHPFAANAQYSLGEIAFSQRKDFARAAKTFGDAYKAYPKHAKAPDMLSKLGASFGQLGMKDQACRTYALLFSEHPGMPDQVRLVTTNDSLRLGCGGAPVQSIYQHDVAAQKDKALALYGQVRCKNIHNFEWTTTGSCPDGATQVAPTVAQSPSQSWASSGNSKASVPAEKVPHPAKHQQGEPPKILIDSMPSTTSGQIIHVVGRVLSKGKITSLMINA
ncbi:tetratricopeptide repeat protein, partial [Magnetospirillum sp. SS-4]|uniref:tetratricopeptide repeat protein n=1 Tax=Magnetospirillum sp. SS-4 TaxID=2681465 RepID=UPI0034CE703C